MEIIGVEQGANLIIGIFVIIGAAIVIALAVLNKFGWIRFGKNGKDDGGHQMSVKELATLIEENVKIRECPAHGPMIKAQEEIVKAHEELVKEVVEMHHQQIKNMALHEHANERINGMSQEFADIKKMLNGIDKKVALLMCLINKGKFYKDKDDSECIG